MQQKIVIALLAVFLSIGRRAMADVHADFKVPTFAIPYVDKAPPMDGAVDDANWQNALSINALLTTDGNISTRSTTFWLAWDNDHLYIAMRSPLRPGERLMQGNRLMGRDNDKVVMDDAYELWINAHTKSPDGEPVLFQYLGNFAGAKYDVMFEPAVGNSRPGWESGWKPVNRITPDGKYWEMTVAVPRQSIYQETPFADGQEISGLFARDFKRPWEQNNTAGSSSFSAADSQCRFTLSKSAPAIHLIAVADVRAGTFGLDLDAISPTAQALKWSFESDGGATQSGTLDLQAGKDAFADPGLTLDKPGPGYYRIKVTSVDSSQTYVDWCAKRAFGDRSATTQPLNDDGKQADLSLTFNPVHNYVRVEGDFVNYDDRKSIDHFVAQVLDAKGTVLAQQKLQIDSLSYVNGLLHLGQCPSGSYVTQLLGYDSTGKEVFSKKTPFEKKDLAREYPWWETPVGRIDRVIAPWTPVHRDGATVSMWGRSLEVGDAGLPAQVTTQAEQILASPATLSGIAIDGSALKISAPAQQSVSDAAYRSVLQCNGTLGAGISVASNVTAEFDGMYKVDMTLTPKSAVEVKSLKVTVPIRPEFADYFNACGEGIRSGFSYGFLPHDKTGVLWDSRQVDGQPMLVGSFIPYVWIGNDRGGLCWFADSDKGWAPSNQTPAIELRRDSADHVDLVLNLISSPTTLTGPRTITFAFEATPVKPLRQGWRMDTWSTGCTFHDFSQVESHGGDLIWTSLPFTLDVKACNQLVQQMHSSNNAFDWGFVDPKYPLCAVPYFENNGISAMFAPAAGYFSDEWRTRVSTSICFCRSVTDFIVYNLDQWCKESNIDGWYVDNVRPVADDNTDAGRGYVLPDGRVQPSYQMFATREHFLRVRAMFQDNGKSGKIVLHMTNHMIMPWIGAADLALDGEDHVTFPEMGKDFIDFWSPARMRLDYWAQSGTAVTFLQEYQGDWKHDDMLRVMRAFTGMTILNDVLPSADPNGNNQPVWIGRHKFGIDDEGVSFIPYWQKDSGVRCDEPTGGDEQSVLSSAWLKHGSILVAVVNRSGDAITATLHLDLAKLKLPPASECEALDPETGQMLTLSADGSISTPLARHDYRQIIVEPKH